MNWILLKEKFPNQYDEIWELYKKENIDGVFLLKKYFQNKNIVPGLLYSKTLQEYEKTKRNNSNLP